MSEKNVHVVPRPTGDWAVRREGADRASAVTRTQGKAIDAGRRIAKREGTEPIVHGENGQIRQKDSFGRDSYPPSAV